MHTTATKAINFTSKDSFSCLKGYLALFVLIHHLYQFTGIFANTYFGQFLLVGVRFAVAMFMFITGFGLYKSFKEKGDDYLKAFPRHRILSFYLTYLFYVIIYLIYGFINGTSFSLKLILTTLTFGGTLVSFGWYLQVVLIMYIAFFVIYRFVKSERIRELILIAFGLSYVLIGFLLGYSSNMLTVVASFLLGLLVAKKETILNKLLEKHLYLISFFSFALMFAGYMLFVRSTIMGRFVINDYLWLLIYCLAEMGAVIFILCLTYFFNNRLKIVIMNPVSRFLGSISLEIYALQGLVLTSLFKIISNRYVFAAVACVCVILLSLLITLIKRAVLSRLLHS